MRATTPFVLAALGIVALSPALAMADAPIMVAQSAKAVLPDSCKLLTDAEVRGVFPDAKAGERERSREQYGISGCIWKNTKGTVIFGIDQYKAKPGSVDNELRGMMTGVLDPLKPSAKGAVRYETLKDVGDQAMAAVERADEKRGILGDTAFLVTQRGDRVIFLGSVELARRDRAAALKALEELGRAAAKRV